MSRLSAALETEYETTGVGGKLDCKFRAIEPRLDETLITFGSDEWWSRGRKAVVRR